MPREYAKIQFCMFTDNGFPELPAFDKLLYIALLAQPSINYAGIQPLNMTRLCRAMRDSDHTPTDAEIQLGLMRLERADYVFTDEITGECLIRTFIRNDGINTQPRLFLSALRAATGIESPKLAGVLLKELQHIGMPAVRSEKPSATKIAENLRLLKTAAETYLESLSNSASDPRARVGAHTPARAPASRDSREVVVEVEVVNSLPELLTLGGHAHAHEPEPAELIDPDNEPPRYCQRHMPNGTDNDCGACMTARQRRTEWLAQRSADASEAARQTALAERHNDLGLRAAAIAHCPLGCAERDGYQPGGIVCDHIDRTETTRNGLSLVRAAMGWSNESHTDFFTRNLVTNNDAAEELF